MSDGPNPPSEEEEKRCGEAAVYLLGLLGERDGAEFLEHARSCALCSDDLAALAPAVDSLSTLVPQLSAPPDSKRQVMAVVRAEARQRKAGQATRRVARGERRWGSLLAARRPVLALAGAGLLAAGFAIGGLAVSSSSGGGAAKVVSADVAPAGATAQLHRSGGNVWLTLARMPQPTAGHVYEVWVKRPRDTLPKPTDSLFTPDIAGTATVAVPLHEGASEVMVTQEPAGGSKLPTSPAIVVARLA